MLREGDGSAEGKMEVFAVKMPRACVRACVFIRGHSGMGLKNWKPQAAGCGLRQIRGSWMVKARHTNHLFSANRNPFLGVGFA